MLLLLQRLFLVPLCALDAFDRFMCAEGGSGGDGDGVRDGGGDGGIVNGERLGGVEEWISDARVLEEI